MTPASVTASAGSRSAEEQLRASPAAPGRVLPARPAVAALAWALSHVGAGCTASGAETRWRGVIRCRIAASSIRSREIPSRCPSARTAALAPNGIANATNTATGTTARVRVQVA